MSRAARAALDVIVDAYPTARRLLIYCGKGNNAGDGYLVAAFARKQGLDATVVTLVNPDELKGDARTAHEAAVSTGVEITGNHFDQSGQADYDVVIDALLGTGFQGEPRAAFAAAIATINAMSLPVVAIDLPSGVNASTGAATQAVNAEHTVTFITRKVGIYTGPGRLKAGQIHFVDLGVPENLYPQAIAHACFWHPSCLPRPGSAAYKHQQGHVLVVGGDHGMPGAVMMAAEAAMRVGAGMVTVATQVTHSSAVVGRVPEVMTIDPDEPGFVERLPDFDLIVLGPGLGRRGWGRNLYQQIERSNRPVLLDADGLYWLSQTGVWAGGSLSMTPHAAEAARLLGITVPELEENRTGSAQRLADKFKARVNLKGPGSILVGHRRLEICMHGNPGMATAGMGDVLSGVAGGILAGAYRQGMTQEEADVLFFSAVALHSCAADNAVARLGPRSLVATDVIRALPETIQTGPNQTGRNQSAGRGDDDEVD